MKVMSSRMKTIWPGILNLRRKVNLKAVSFLRICSKKLAFLSMLRQVNMNLNMVIGQVNFQILFRMKLGCLIRWNLSDQAIQFGNCLILNVKVFLAKIQNNNLTEFRKLGLAIKIRLAFISKRVINLLKLAKAIQNLKIVISMTKKNLLDLVEQSSLV